jgi:O-antigen ligase
MDVGGSRERNVALTAGIVFSAAYAAALALSGGETAVVIAGPVLGVLLFIQTEFELALFAVIIALFVDVHLSYFSSAVWMSIPFATAFLLNARGRTKPGFSNPVTVPFVLYCILILPSFLNAVDPGRSVAWLFNLLAFAAVFFPLSAGAQSRNTIRRAGMLFIILSVLNGIEVIVEGLISGRRAFGIAGIMYVDYSGLGLTVTAAMTLALRGHRRILPLLATMLLAAALALTQTRNSWISAGVTLLVLLGYVFFHTEIAGVSRRKLAAVATAGILVMGLALWSLTEINPEIARRASDIGEVEASESGKSIVIKNSLVTRLLIWDTALQAFYAHPIVGVGVYGFSSASAQFTRIPSQLYRDYVEGVSPHIAYLAVLAETGIVGMIGFLIFVGAGLRTALRSMRVGPGGEGTVFALAGLAAVVYCCISMAMTDAWLWGQGIVLFGITLGLVIANSRIPDDDAPGR